MEFEEFLGARLPALLRFGTVLTGDPRLAEDLVQDALVRAARRWRGTDASEARAKFLIAGEHIARSGPGLWRRSPLRTAQTTEELVPAGAAEVEPRAGGDGTADPGETATALERVAELSPRQRAVLALWCYERLSPGEIAEGLSRPMKAIRSQAAEALEVLAPFSAEDAREAFEELAAEAPGPSRVLARLGPARRQDRQRRRLVVGSVTAVVVVGLGAGYIVTHQSEPDPVIGPVSTISYGYAPGWLPDGFREVIRGSGSDGVSRTWALGGWQRGPTSLRLILTVADRWSGPGHTGIDRWLETGDHSTAISINAHPGRQFSDSDHTCTVAWLESPERMIKVWGVSASGQCETVVRTARSVRPVGGVTARQPLRIPSRWAGKDAVSEVIESQQGCTAALTLFPAGVASPIIVELRSGDFPKAGTAFRLGGRRARYYSAVLDWSRPPYYLDGPGVAVDLGAGRTLIVAGQSFDPGVVPPAQGTSRRALEQIARAVTAGPIDSCAWK